MKIYYFEIKVLNQGAHGMIGIGLTSEGSPLNRMPGWEKSTIGYHGDDGKLFYEFGSGRDYGRTFGTSDVVGCGIDLDSRKVFFTKNGMFLGIAKSKLPNKTWYPTIGLHSKDEMVEVNFGQEPFIFKISKYSGMH